MSDAEDAAQKLAHALNQARKLLSEEQAALAMLVRSHEDEVVRTLDGMGIITGATSRAQQVLGRDVDSLLSKPVDILLKNGSRSVLQSAEEMGEADEGQVAHSTRTHERPDGSTFDADHTVLAVVGPSGELTGFIRRIKDTRRRRIHEIQIDELNTSIALLLGH